jgi:uncharacterized membrane protein
MTPEMPSTSPGEEPAKPGDASQVAPSSSAGLAGPGDLVMKILGAVGTGIGILGFVTFFGGAIFWIRAEKAHLPANDVVSAIPNSVLVTTGASFLVPAVLIATLALVVIFLVHLRYDLPRKIRARSGFRTARKLRLEAEKLARDAMPEEQLAKAARALGVSLTEDAEQISQNPAASIEVKAQQVKAAADQRHEAERREAAALAAASAAAEKKTAADNQQAISESSLERSPRQLDIELAVGALMLTFVPPILNNAIFHVGIVRGLLLLGVAALAAVISLLTYVGTERFLWFGVVAFVTVGIYIGVATYYSTTINPKVEPAAALRAGRPPVVGIYIADTASNLYLGSFSDEEDGSRLLVVPRAQVTDLAIGPLVNPGAAPKRAAQLALDRCEQKIEVAKTDTEPASLKPACTDEEEEALKELLG